MQPPDNLATYDHLVTRSNAGRHKPVPRPGVLSCYKCNHARGFADRKERGKWSRVI